jgi:polyisoprenoid-binding protein YceI
VIAAVVVVPLALLVGAYLLFFTDDSPSELTLSDPPATQPGATGGTSSGSASTLEGTWNVAPGSVAGYRVREKLAALPATSDAVGRTESVTGTVTLRSDGNGVVADGVDVEVDVSTLKSNEDRRDNRIRTTGLQTDQFPTATFTSTGPVTLPDALATGQAVTADVAGQLTIHGVAKQVTIPLEIRLNGSQGEVVGSLKFPFSDFGMSPPSVGGFVSVESDATLEFKLLLTPA